MLTEIRSPSPSGNYCRLVSSFLLVLFCLVRMDRYLAVTNRAVIEQRPATEQVEPFKPDYRFPVLREHSSASESITVSVDRERNAFLDALFRLPGYTCTIAARLEQVSRSSLHPDPFGYLRSRHRAASPDDDADAPVLI
ncbi:MAG: hypothetical protein JW863_06310 [Chitinispirillaceae bacterium]|nr:hypothetical protein [Chitinispirillaceae bacterium]